MKPQFLLVRWNEFLAAAYAADAVVAGMPVRAGEAGKDAVVRIRMHIADGWTPDSVLRSDGREWLCLRPPTRIDDVEEAEVLPPKEQDVVVVEALVFTVTDTRYVLPADVVTLRIPQLEALGRRPSDLGLIARLRPNTDVPQSTWSCVVFRSRGWEALYQC